MSTTIPIELEVHKGSRDLLDGLDAVRERVKAGEITSIVIAWDGPKNSGRRRHVSAFDAIPHLNAELDMLKRDMLALWDDEQARNPNE